MSAGGMRIAVCDDIRTDCEQVAVLTETILQEAGIVHNISKYESGRKLLDDIEKGQQYNLLLLDVMMDELDGIAFGGALRRMQKKTPIIYISINREMALCGYEVSAVRYLTKPLDVSKLKEALLYYCREWQEKKEILLPTEQGQYRISISDIQFIEAYDRGTRFCLKKEIVECKLGLGEVEKLLPLSSYVSCHRAYIVNLACVTNITRYEFTLKSGKTVPIGKARYNEINKKYIEYIAD